MKLKIFLITVFLVFSLTSSKFAPPKSTKNLSQKLQRYAVIRDSEETYISLFARPILNFLFIKKAGSFPFLRIQNFDERCLDSTRTEFSKNIKIEFLFISGSKIVIKNVNSNFKNFEISTNCGEFGPINEFRYFGEMKLNNWISLMDLCFKQYQKVDEKFEAVEVRIQSNVKCGFFMVLGKDFYISNLPNSNAPHPSDALLFNSNSDVPEKFKDSININEKSNEVEIGLKQKLPEKIGFIGEEFFGIPSFRFNFDKNCSNNLAFLQFYDNPKCMATVSVDSANNLIIETTYGSISIQKNDLSKTKFFADSSMIYSVTETDSYSILDIESIILCEIYSTEIEPYFKITKVKESNLKCTKAVIIFGGTLAEDDGSKMSLFILEAPSPWLAALPYVGILCILLLLAIASFLAYCCIRRHRKHKNKKNQKQKQKLLSKLPTAEEEKDLEPNTLSKIIDQEFEEKQIQPKPKTFKVIVPAVLNENDNYNKPPSSSPPKEKQKE